MWSFMYEYAYLSKQSLWHIWECDIKGRNITDILYEHLINQEVCEVQAWFCNFRKFMILLFYLTVDFFVATWTIDSGFKIMEV